MLGKREIYRDVTLVDTELLKAYQVNLVFFKDALESLCLCVHCFPGRQAVNIYAEELDRLFAFASGPDLLV